MGQNMTEITGLTIETETLSRTTRLRKERNRTPFTDARLKSEYGYETVFSLV